MIAHNRIRKLVETFDYNLETYKKGSYNETQVRREFIDPFFEELGWDITNKRGYAEAYKHVIHEDAIKVGGVTKAPDYCFRIGSVRKFFLEAKKPSVNIKQDLHPAYQLRRYGWSAKLPLSILTDFEEFAVYDCRVKPTKTDKASHSRILYLKYTEYIDRWNEISDIFSREAIKKGSFDKYIESKKTKRGTAEVDAAFLQEIDRWRELLARNIALRNPNLSQRELNFAVQQTIDRIVFFRICEDRGIENYGRLRALQNGDNVYNRLFKLFQKADDKYNSGLFHFIKEKGRENFDSLTPKLRIDDKVLKDIFKNLYYPDSPYEFSVLPADLLGQVYEKFLGKIIRLTAKHQAKVEEKPEVRKAGGVYYTPTYIVDHIVSKTVGKLVEGKKAGPRGAVSKLKILDPACGSGSFLIGAYQFLLDWHLDQYLANNPKIWTRGKVPIIYKNIKGEWKLTTDERKRILLNNIYGVDIDSQAVEVTKLSLLLKVLEGEDEQSIGKQMTLFQERVLPDLSNNIKCGNSLVGHDFYDNQALDLLDEDEIFRTNAFNWREEFPEIINSGGFNAVIGNPPYLRIQGLQEYYKNQINYFSKKYQSAVKRFDLYLLFLEKGFNLLSENGYLGYITPHKFLNSDFGSGLRKFFIDNTAIEFFICFGNNLVFRDATTYTGILVLQKSKKNLFNYYEFDDLPILELPKSLNELEKKDFAQYRWKNLSSSPWSLTSTTIQKILLKIQKQKNTLGVIFDNIFQGIVTGSDEIYFLEKLGEYKGEIIEVLSKREGTNIKIERSILRPLLKGEDVNRFNEPVCRHYCIYPYKLIDSKTKIIEEKELSEKFPLAYQYLKKYQNELRNLRVKYKTNPKYWYSCHRGRSMDLFGKDRIISPEISLGCNMTISLPEFYHNTKVYSIVPPSSRKEHIYYWLSILNSKVMWWFIKNTGYVLRGGYYVFKTNYLKPFPIREINFNDFNDKSDHDKIVNLVEQMFDFKKKIEVTTIPQTKILLKRQIGSTDRKIDQLVYKLYDLTEEEIQTVESNTRNNKTNYP